jgi:HAD superfamily hydrolase (TIGR01459 family)
VTQIIDALSDISTHYDTLFCDLWGCVHDGITALPEAVTALQIFKSAGGTVVLVTNSPRPRASVRDQLRSFNVPDECWDIIATSGDSARAAMFAGAVGTKIWHIGEAEDDPFFERMSLMPDAPDIIRVDLDHAQGVVCTGPFDPHADPETLRPQLMLAREKGLKLLCANPDIVVDRGETREWCAGALAKLYTELGGESLYFGKPHPPIYDLARRRLHQIGKPTPDARILAVGDGIHTDVLGGLGENIDTLFISGGLARQATATTRQPDPEKLTAYLADHALSPTYTIGMLR